MVAVVAIATKSVATRTDHPGIWFLLFNIGFPQDFEVFIKKKEGSK